MHPRGAVKPRFHKSFLFGLCKRVCPRVKFRFAETVPGTSMRAALHNEGAYEASVETHLANASVGHAHVDPFLANLRRDQVRHARL